MEKRTCKFDVKCGEICVDCLREQIRKYPVIAKSVLENLGYEVVKDA